MFIRGFRVFEQKSGSAIQPYLWPCLVSCMFGVCWRELICRTKLKGYPFNYLLVSSYQMKWRQESCADGRRVCISSKFTQINLWCLCCKFQDHRCTLSEPWCNGCDNSFLPDIRWGLLSRFPPFDYFPSYFAKSSKQVTYWISHPYLTGDTTA